MNEFDLTISDEEVEVILSQEPLWKQPKYSNEFIHAPHNEIELNFEFRSMQSGFSLPTVEIYEDPCSVISKWLSSNLRGQVRSMDGCGKFRIVADCFLPQSFELIFAKFKYTDLPIGWERRTTPKGIMVMHVKNSYEELNYIFGENWCFFEGVRGAYRRLDYRKGVRFAYNPKSLKLSVAGRFMLFNMYHYLVWS